MINNNPTVLYLVKVGDEIEGFNKKQLCTTFTFLYGQEPKIKDKSRLIRACRYLVQERYYETIFKKPVSESIKLKTQELIKECV